MIKMISVFGAIAVIAIIIVAFAGVPKAEVEALSSSSLTHDCTMQNVPLDEGYGVSRTVVRRVCAEP